MTKDMTMGSPLRMILLFSVPVLLGNIFQQFYKAWTAKRQCLFLRKNINFLFSQKKRFFRGKLL